ncbi:MAG: peptidylprolyl isomerase [Planctomycetota bacterium]
MQRVSARRRKAGIVVLLAVVATMGVIVAGVVIRGRLARATNPRVVIETSMGEMTVVLRADKAPQTVASFLQYAREGFYDGLIFHRVIKDFVIQGGAVTPDLQERPTHGYIANEAKWHMPNRKGTLAMARGAAPNSATAGFYINLADHRDLDADPATGREGYCVFGEVVAGFNVALRIGNVETGPAGPMSAHVPVEPVVIHRIRRIDDGPPLPTTERDQPQRRPDGDPTDDDPHRYRQGPHHRPPAGRPDAQDGGELPAVR